MDDTNPWALLCTKKSLITKVWERGRKVEVARGLPFIGWPLISENEDSVVGHCDR
jgi:hypothetical protein